MASIETLPAIANRNRMRFHPLSISISTFTVENGRLSIEGLIQSKRGISGIQVSPHKSAGPNLDVQFGPASTPDSFHPKANDPIREMSQIHIQGDLPSAFQDIDRLQRLKLYMRIHVSPDLRILKVLTFSDLTKKSRIHVRHGTGDFHWGLSGVQYSEAHDLHVNGWCFSREKVDQVRFYLGRAFLGKAPVNLSRIDVYSRFADCTDKNCGFAFSRLLLTKNRIPLFLKFYAGHQPVFILGKHYCRKCPVTEGPWQKMARLLAGALRLPLPAWVTVRYQKRRSSRSGSSHSVPPTEKQVIAKFLASIRALNEHAIPHGDGRTKALIYCADVSGHRHLHSAYFIRKFLSRGFEVYFFFAGMPERMLSSGKINYREFESSYLDFFKENQDVHFVNISDELHAIRNEFGFIAKIQQTLAPDISLFIDGDAMKLLFLKQLLPWRKRLPTKSFSMFSITEFAHVPRHGFRVFEEFPRLLYAWFFKRYIFADRVGFVQKFPLTNRFCFGLILRFKLLASAFCSDPVFVKGINHPRLVFMHEPITGDLPERVSAEEATFNQRVRSEYQEFLERNMGRHVLLHFGDLEARKGYDLLLQLAAHEPDSVCARFGRTKSNYSPTRQAIIFKEKLTKEDRLFEVDAYLQSRELIDFIFSTASYIILPYREYYRTSGVLIEALHRGLPVLTADKGVMAHLVRHFRLGKTFQDGNFQELLRIFSQFKTSYPQYRKQVAVFNHMFSKLDGDEHLVPAARQATSAPEGSKLMRIAVFATNSKNSYSGGRYLSLMLAECLAHRHHDVCYVTNNRPAFFNDFRIHAGHRHIQFFISRDFSLLPPTGKFDFVVLIPHQNPDGRFYEKVRNFARSTEAHLVLFNFESPNWFNQYAPSKRDEHHWLQWKKSCTQGCLVLSMAREGQAYAEKYYTLNLLGTRFDYWYPAINSPAADRIPSQRKQNRIVALPRFEDRHKGGEELFELMDQTLSGYTVVLILGRGAIDKSRRARMRELRRKFGIRFKILTRVSDSRKFKEIKKAKLMLFPSHFEGYGYPPVEALHCGTACVAYDLPVLRETCGDSLIYARWGDTNDFKSKIKSALQADFQSAFDRTPRPAIGNFERQAFELEQTLSRYHGSRFPSCPIRPTDLQYGISKITRDVHDRIVVKGWICAPTRIESVSVYLDSQLLGTSNVDMERKDVFEKIDCCTNLRCGFFLTASFPEKTSARLKLEFFDRGILVTCVERDMDLPLRCPVPAQKSARRGSSTWLMQEVDRSPEMRLRMEMAERGQCQANDRRIALLRNKHRGEVAFLIGNGPSVRIEDLDKLNGRVSFGCNRLHLAYGSMKFRPTYVGSVDQQVIQDFGMEMIENNPGSVFFVSEQPPPLPGDYVWFRMKSRTPLEFSENVYDFVMPGGGTLIAAMQIGYHMGITKFVLYGIDHDFSFRRNEGASDPWHSASGDGNHFIPDYRSGKSWAAPNLLQVEGAYLSCHLFMQSKGGWVKNATRGGKLEVLERIDFDRICLSGSEKA